MLRAGIEIKNDFGDVQITDDKVYFSKTSSFTLGSGGWAARPMPASSYVGDTLVKEVVIPHPPSEAPMVAYVPAGNGVMCEIVRSSATTTTYRFYTRSAAAAGPTRVYVFSTKRPAIGKDGLELFDDSGGIIFSSSTPIARIICMNINGVNSIDPPANRTYAIVTAKNAARYHFSVRYSSGGAGSMAFFRQTYRYTWFLPRINSNATLSFDETTMGRQDVFQAPSDSPTVEDEQWYDDRSYLLVDVTDL